MNADPRLGRVVGGRYSIVRRLGAGGMGTVYEARHTVVGRRFAVKFLRSDLAERPRMVERFRREARAAGALESEHIAAVVDFGVDDEAPFLVMEYLRGTDLARIFERTGPLSLPRAASIVMQACRGLDAAHREGVVHRDLKPANLFICRTHDGADLVKILDFGLAKLTKSERDAALTRSGAALGTAHYMAPEQARGDDNVDERVDIYALGAILYEALSGELPHPGDSYNAVLYHVLTRDPVPLEELRPGLPRDICELCARALSRDADARPANADELARALAPYAAPPAPEECATDGTAATVPEASFEAPPPRRRARSMPLVLGASLAAFGAVAAWQAFPTATPAPAASALSVPSSAAPHAASVAVAAPSPAPLPGAPRATATVADVRANVREQPAPPRPAEPERPAPRENPAMSATASIPYDRSNPYGP